jgi:hypothetical protein
MPMDSTHLDYDANLYAWLRVMCSPARIQSKRCARSGALDGPMPNKDLVSFKGGGGGSRRPR